MPRHPRAGLGSTLKANLWSKGWSDSLPHDVVGGSVAGAGQVATIKLKIEKPPQGISVDAVRLVS
jgi:hypothetical protein